MADLLDDIDALGEVDGARLRGERLLRLAVERILIALVDLAVDVNSHLSSSLLGRAPADYRESFGLAAELGALNQELARSLAPSTGFRNVLVHQYLEIDLDKVASAVDGARYGYRRYVESVAGFLRSGGFG